MTDQITVLGIECQIIRKDIKNIHLSVHPPNGVVSVSVPIDTEIKILQLFLTSKIAWIRKQQRAFAEQERETPREFIERESHYLWGQRYLLEITEKDEAPSFSLDHITLHLTLKPHTNFARKQEIFAQWYREELKIKALDLIAKWEKILGVTVEKLFIQHMKTKWGSCTHKKKYIRLNTELAKKDPQCLEFIVVHEMLHLIEPTHNKRFKALMDFHLPHWPIYRQVLNNTPLSHEDWKY